MIEEIKLSRLRIPLAKPYKLAFGDVTHFDTLLVELVADGRPGFGEATILNGYTQETVEGSWALAQALTQRLKGLSPEAARRTLETDVRGRAPFTATAFQTALEMAAGHPLLDVEKSTGVPLLFGINATDPAGIERELEGALDGGYRTLKIKAGFDLEADLARVGYIQALEPRPRQAAHRCQPGLLQGRRLRLRTPGVAGFGTSCWSSRATPATGTPHGPSRKYHAFRSCSMNRSTIWPTSSARPASALPSSSSS